MESIGRNIAAISRDYVEGMLSLRKMIISGHRQRIYMRSETRLDVVRLWPGVMMVIIVVLARVK